MRISPRGRLAAGAPLLAALVIAGCSNVTSGGTGAAATITSTGASNLSGVVGTPIGPFVFVVRDADSNVVSGVPVTFTISGAGNLNTASATTDNGGSVLTTITFTHTVGVATVTATAAGVATPASVSATAVADAPTKIVPNVGDGQSAPVGTPFGEKLGVLVTDQYDNPVSGILIVWSSQGGTFGAGTSRTDNDGHAVNTFTPTTIGTTRITAAATFASAQFTASGT